MKTTTTKKTTNIVYLGIGSNIGKRCNNIRNAIKEFNPNIINTSFLYESKGIGINEIKTTKTFFNCCIEIKTTLNEGELLDKIKDIEYKFGRDINKIYDNNNKKSRIIDIDILFYKNFNYVNKTISPNKRELIIPHPRIMERDFVLKPLCDLIENNINLHKIDKNLINKNEIIDYDYIKYYNKLFNKLLDIENDENNKSIISQIMNIGKKNIIKNDDDDDDDDDNENIIRINYKKNINFMQILNITPDSFSDGGIYNIKNNKKIFNLINEIINDYKFDKHNNNNNNNILLFDIGGESTRPNSDIVNVKEEINRTLPVIKSIRNKFKNDNIILSIDTYKSKVAEKAIIDGDINIINDVSGGKFDNKILNISQKYNIPIILGHLEGNVNNFHQSNNVYKLKNNFKKEIYQLLLKIGYNAILNYQIPKFDIILDPGVGFSKTYEHNLIIMNNLNYIIKNLNNYPVMLGTSRKKFLQNLYKNVIYKDNIYKDNNIVLNLKDNDILLNNIDNITALTTLQAYNAGISFVRVHNVKTNLRNLKISKKLNLIK